MPMAMATRNDSFITENGSSRAKVRRTRRGPRLSPSAGLLAEVGLAGLRLAPREAEPRPEPSVPVSVGVSSSAAGSFDVGSDCVVLAWELLVATDHSSFGTSPVGDEETQIGRAHV